MQSALAISGLINGLFSIFFGLLVFISNRKSIVNRLLFFFSLSVGFWSLGYWRWLLIYNDPTTALFWLRILTIFSVLIPTFYIHWIIALLEIKKRRKIFLTFCYLLTAFFLSISFSTLFVVGVKPALRFAFWPIPGFWYLYFVAYFCFAFIYAFFLLVKNYTKTNDLKKKKQLSYLIVGSIMGSLGGVTNFPLWYGIPILPLGNFLVAVYVFIYTYTIIRYQFMNMKLILRRSVVFGLSFISVVAPLLVLDYLVGLVFVYYARIFEVIILIGALLAFPGLKRYYFNLANRFFFSSLYDSRKLITDINNSLRSTLDPRKIFSSISDIIFKSFHCQAIGVLYYNEGRQAWTVAYENGLKFPGNNFSIKRNVVDAIFPKGNMVALIKKINQGDYTRSGSFFDFLSEIKAEVILPISIKGKLTGIMILGAKESGDNYAKEDVQVLEILSSELSMALDNALLYQEASQFNLELQKKIDIATKKLRLKNDELVKVNNLKNEFISVISHQLKTPLASAKLTLEILGIKFRSAFKGEAGTMVESLTTINEQLIKMVNELLDVARIEEGRLKVEIQQIDLISLIKKTVLEFAPLATKRNIKIIENYQSLPVFEFDLQILEKAIANLLSNGIKYNSEGKELVIDLTFNTAGILLAVKDHGIGIPKADQKKIFQKFYQASNAAAARLETSTGLGLYITKSSIEHLGGKVWFESAEGVGTTFFVQLPLKAVDNSSKITKV